jgi:hypothetical protein
MDDNDVRVFKEVAKAISGYTENPEEFLAKMRKSGNASRKDRDTEKDKDKKKSKEDEKKEKSAEELDSKKKVIIQRPDQEKSKIGGFKFLDSIDDNIAQLLFDNNIKTIDDLEKLTFKDLIKIKGIKRKNAKMIIKEIEEKVKI